MLNIYVFEQRNVIMTATSRYLRLTCSELLFVNVKLGLVDFCLMLVLFSV